MLKALNYTKEDIDMSKVNFVEVEMLEVMRGPVENLEHLDEFHFWNTVLSFYGLDAIPTNRKEV